MNISRKSFLTFSTRTRSFSYVVCTLTPCTCFCHTRHSSLTYHSLRPVRFLKIRSSLIISDVAVKLSAEATVISQLSQGWRVCFRVSCGGFLSIGLPHAMDASCTWRQQSKREQKWGPCWEPHSFITKSRKSFHL